MFSWANASSCSASRMTHLKYSCCSRSRAEPGLAKVHADLPDRAVHGQRPEVVADVAGRIADLEQQQHEVGEHHVEVELADHLRDAEHGCCVVAREEQAFQRRQGTGRVVLARPDAVMVVEIDVLEADETLVVLDEGVTHEEAVLEGQVVKLVLGVEGHLPVRALVDPVGLHQRHLVEGAAVELTGDAAEVFAQRLGRLGRQIDEDEALPDARVDRGEAVLPLVEAEEILLVRHADQRAGVAVDPVVEVAVEAAGARALLVQHQRVAAVGADVVEGAHHTVRAPDEQQGDLADGEVADDIVAGLRDVVHAADVDPAPAEDALALQRVVRRPSNRAR